MEKKELTINKRKKRYRAVLVALLACCFIGIAFCYRMELERKIPDRVLLFRNQSAKMQWKAPLEGKFSQQKADIAITTAGKPLQSKDSFPLSHDITFEAHDVGSYQAELKLFGIFPYKNIRIDVIEKEQVMPSGKAVGLYIRSRGILILGTAAVAGKDGLSYEPAKEIVQPGDYLYRVNGKKVRNIDEVVRIVQGSRGKKTKLYLHRGQNDIVVKLDSVKASDGEYRLGIWLREDTEGIGTLSFVTKKNQFAALGHGITDIDTGSLLHLKSGEVYPASIRSVKKGAAGTPGELIGSVTLGEDRKLGEIKNNTLLGISGKIDSSEYSYQENKALPIGLKQQVKKGKAHILCQLGSTVEKYEIEVEDMDMNSRDNKGMVLRITDRRLLQKTGGIVQGMSGSPIIQNGRVIGAVTHVFVNDPTRGYGIFIENMLEH